MFELRETKLIDGVVTNDLYDRRSPFLGRCSLDPNSALAWINVPKNASNTIGSFIRHWRSSNWFDESELVKNREFFMVLRDPVDRWKKSVLETIRIFLEHSRLTAEAEWKIVKDGIDIDGLKNFEYNDDGGSYRGILNIHTFRQVDHLIGLRLSSVRFLLLDEPSFDEELRRILDVQSSRHMNSTMDSSIKMRFLPMLKEELFSEELDSRLREIYASDYSLIDYAAGRVKEPTISWRLTDSL